MILSELILYELGQERYRNTPICFSTNQNKSGKPLSADPFCKSLKNGQKELTGKFPRNSAQTLIEFFCTTNQKRGWTSQWNQLFDFLVVPLRQEPVKRCMRLSAPFPADLLRHLSWVICVRLQRVVLAVSPDLGLCQELSRNPNPSQNIFWGKEKGSRSIFAHKKVIYSASQTKILLSKLNSNSSYQRKTCHFEGKGNRFPRENSISRRENFCFWGKFVNLPRGKVLPLKMFRASAFWRHCRANKRLTAVQTEGALRGFPSFND